MDFVSFKKAVSAQLAMMAQHPLYVTGTDKDELWNTYLSAFPPGSNPIFRERTEHDCQCCKQFIRAAGNIVAIIDGVTVSIWDQAANSPDLQHYQIVAQQMAAYVHGQPITDIFLHSESVLGTDYNFDTKAIETPLRFDHFHFKLPNKFVNTRDLDSQRGQARANHDVLRRSLQEITLEAAETVQELIQQNSLYRGEEHLGIVKAFIRAKTHYMALTSRPREWFCWQLSSELKMAGRFRNTVIGTLMDDLSNGVDLEDAVRMFETKVAPQNYKRPTALVTKAMIDKAQTEVRELGFEDALPRRYAVMDDITVNNVLFADRTSRQAMGVFDEMARETTVNPGKFGKVEEIPVETFVNQVLPSVRSLDLLVENRHVGNFMSLIAPVYKTAPNILKWDNNFSWTYRGEVTDSIKERVKRAGGNVTGDLRCSLSWFNHDDLDLHMVEPGGYEIFFGNKGRKSKSGGVLDVDMNAGCGTTRQPVENIVYRDKCTMKEGTYHLFVHNYSKRETSDIGFVVEIEFEGRLMTFPYPKAVKDGERVTVAIFNYSRKDGLSIVRSLDSTDTSKTEWGIATQTFVPVKLVMLSPNHWDGQSRGNKHWFFILDGCKQDGSARGLYNEFLDARLEDHRKVFEMLGSRMKAEPSDDQLSGVGFSSTKRDSVLCRLTGSFNRVVKIVF